MLRGLARRVGNHGHLPVQPCRQGEARSDRPEHSVCSRLPFYSHHSRLIPFFCRDILRIRRTVREIDLSALIPRSEEVEEDRLVHSLLAEFEVVPVNRRFGTIVCWNIVPSASRGQDVQDAVEQPARVTPGSADVRLCWREVVPDNLPEISINFPEGHTPEYSLRGLINLGRPHVYSSLPNLPNYHSIN